MSQPRYGVNAAGQIVRNADSSHLSVWEASELLTDLEEQLQSVETTLAHAEAFIEHQDMSYRWAEWCEGRDPNPAKKPDASEADAPVLGRVDSPSESTASETSDPRAVELQARRAGAFIPRSSE